jgi:hypothetical protein
VDLFYHKLYFNGGKNKRLVLPWLSIPPKVDWRPG